ncbi:MAG: hypothetical protein K2X03_05295 [Bryobacteraceae bacterium]|nr:hypothetical protein [Bryobacteraceae bacterium]
MTRRALLSLGAMAMVCPPDDQEPLDFGHLPNSAHAFADDYALGPGKWEAYRQTQQQTLLRRIDEGSAEHITYYVLQGRLFTTLPAVDPVRLAAAKPVAMPSVVAQRFAAFAQANVRDRRHQLVRDLQTKLSWTPEACFLHTMAFLARTRVAASRGLLYQQRGLSSDTAPRQTLVIDQALPHLGRRPTGPALLVGPGLDLTRREGFVDRTPLRAYQADRLKDLPLECVDVRPEVLAYLASESLCVRQLDITTTVPSSQARYTLAVATNVLLYLDDRALFAALAGLARSLAPGGYLIHNDTRFAAKAFGEALALPVTHFAPISLGKRQGVELMDRAVIHRKS